MNTNDPEPLDDFTRLYAKMTAMEIVLSVLIGRLSEENPEVRGGREAGRRSDPRRASVGDPQRGN